MDFLSQIIKEEASYGKSWVISRYLKLISDNNPSYEQLVDVKKTFIPKKIDQCDEGLSSSRFVSNVCFHSSYFAARVVGKNGKVIKFIRKISSTEIISPQCGFQHRKTILTNSQRPFLSIVPWDSFVIVSQNCFDAFYAYVLIIATGLFFMQKFRLLITPKSGEICEIFQVHNKMVPFLLKDGGYRIIQIQWVSDVRIVSPKPYCPPCNFYIIGREADVKIATRLLTDIISQYHLNKQHHNVNS